MVIEGIITTENQDGSMHLAPIGPHVDQELTTWVLRPFQTSISFANLRIHNRGVFHVTDDSLLMAAAVLGLCTNSSNADIQSAVKAQCDPTQGWVLEQCCRSFALTVREWDVSQPRAVAYCELQRQREQRPFWGWNRAANSILELSILASRRHMVDRQVLVDEMDRHRIIIEKTAGPRELAAWELLKAHLSQ
jgi:hypothetical protein